MSLHQAYPRTPAPHSCPRSLQPPFYSSLSLSVPLCQSPGPRSSCKDTTELLAYHAIGHDHGRPDNSDSRALQDSAHSSARAK
eukprot:5457655-Heterocapsa_arctica.AAC.1